MGSGMTLNTLARQAAQAADLCWWDMTTSEEPCEHHHEYIADAVVTAMKRATMPLYIVVIETTDDPSEIVAAYQEKSMADERASAINATLKGGYSVAVVKQTNLE